MRTYVWKQRPPVDAAPPRRVTVRYQRPYLYPKQRAAIFCPERYAVVEASTKSGKTAGCTAWIVEKALQGKEGQNFWWVAPVFGQAKIAFNRVRRGLPHWMFVPNLSEMRLDLINGTALWFRSAEKPDSLYGEDVYAAVLDEATRMREEAYHAVRTTLTATRGPVRIIGNVKGRKNWAYRMARQAESGEPDMHYARITAIDAVAAGVLAAEEIEDARRRLPEPVFRELYMTEPTEDGSNPFGIPAIARCVAALSSTPAVAWGVDLAKSIDWTVAIALDQAGRMVTWDRFQRPWPETKAAISAAIRGVPALVDSTGVGDPIVEDLQRTAPSADLVEGFKFSATSKQQIMEGLAAAIQAGEVTIPPDSVIRTELESFEFVYTRTGVRYAAPEGMHDDCVDALALAVHCRATKRRAPARLWGGPGLEDEDHAA